MARELTAEELGELLPEDRERRLRSKRQADLDAVNVHVVAEQNLAVRLSGAVIVAGGDGTRSASPQELASALNRFPRLEKMIHAAQKGAK